VLDASGKPETGILLGNLNFIGSFDECIGVIASNTSVSDFKAQYCTASIPGPRVGLTPSKSERDLIINLPLDLELLYKRE